MIMGAAEAEEGAGWREQTPAAFAFVTRSTPTPTSSGTSKMLG